MTEQSSSKIASSSFPSPLDFRTERLKQFREERIADAGILYLGYPLAEQPACHWIRNGRENILVFKDCKDSSLTEETLSDSSQTGLSNEEAPSAAILSIVCALRSDGFWLTSDGGFNGSSSITKEFVNTELSAVGIAPDNVTSPETSMFVEDFKRVQTNVKTLLDLVGTPNVENKGFVLPGETAAFRFKHPLFEKIENNDAEHEGNDGGELLRTWPRTNNAVARSLADLEQQNPPHYKISPLPAYDYHSALIQPESYKKALENAVVEVRFTLSHWPIGARDKGLGSNAYRASIIDMLVLCPPPPTVVTPRKRKVSSYHPSSPTRKKIILHK